MQSFFSFFEDWRTYVKVLWLLIINLCGAKDDSDFLKRKMIFFFLFLGWVLELRRKQTSVYLFLKLVYPILNLFLCRNMVLDLLFSEEWIQLPPPALNQFISFLIIKIMKGQTIIILLLAITITQAQWSSCPSPSALKMSQRTFFVI